MSTARPTPRVRDPRLDFFRGLAMFIIVIAHTPGNPWARWIPARFGFSDATEIFVFCSGMASAIAFGATFARRGFWIGTARVLFRSWQVYWAHIGTFFVIAALMVWLNSFEGLERNYVSQLNLIPFFRDPAANLVGLMTLTYVPNYFDILPMYLVILMMMPLMIGLAHIHPALAGLTAITIWLAAFNGLLSLPAEPWSERTWFFNPFGWQLLFFTGFAFMAGWLRPPPVHAALIALALVVVLVILPLAHFRFLNAVPDLRATEIALRPYKAKTELGPLRILHFLALAYLAWVAVGPMGARLSAGVWWPRVVAVIRKVGQQSLAIFVSGLVLSRLLGVALDHFGRETLPVALVNLVGIATVIGLAYFVAWFKSAPWNAPVPAPPVTKDAAPPVVAGGELAREGGH